MQEIKPIISFFGILKFNSKMILREKSFVVLNVLINVVSVVFAIITPFFISGDKVLFAFNFYILIYISIFLFLNILRTLQFYFINSLDNKLLYLISINQLSRTKIFLSQFLLITIFNTINSIIAFCMLNIFAQINSNYVELIFRLSYVFLIYVFFVTIFLSSFILFLMLLSSIQVTTILCTLIISITFLSNLPYKFLKTKEKSITLKFNDANNQLIKVPDLYDSFDLQKNIKEGKIKYKYLSSYINKFLVEDNSFVKETFYSEEGVMTRLTDLWSGLGLVKTETTNFEVDNLDVLTVPTTMSELRGKKVSLKFSLNNTFISAEELENLVQETSLENHLVIKDFYNFVNDITAQIANFQNANADLFSDFVFLATTPDTNYITDGNLKFDLTKSDVINFYKYNLAPNAASQTGLTFLDTTYINDFVKNKMYFVNMLCAVLLEDYLINYTSKFIIATNNKTDVTNSGWSDYLKGRKQYKIFSYFNLFNGIWSNFTFNAGFSYDDIWFSPHSASKIYLNDQQNLFLGYVNYNFSVNSEGMIAKDVYNDYINPWYFIVAQLIFSLILFSFSLYKFNRLDFR